MDSLITFLSDMPFWYWWVFALVLLAIEMVTGSTYFFWPSLAAFTAGFFDLGPLDGQWQLQLIVFAAVTVVLSLFAPRYVKPWLQRTQTDHLTLNERGAQKVGRRVTVEADFVNGAGKVQVGDTLWIAESETGESFLAGAVVEITRAEGTKLYVKSVA